MEIAANRTSSVRCLDLAIECVWLLVIFTVPVVFNPFSLNAFYFIKALAMVLLVCVMLGLVIARWMLNLRESGYLQALRLIKRSPLQVAAAVYGFLWVISTLFSIMPFKSIWGNLGGTVGLPPNLAWVVFFLVMANDIRSREQVFRALYVLLISSGAVALVGIIQYFVPGILPWFRFQGRVFSTDGNPLFLSAFLSMTLPVTLAMIILNWYGSKQIRRNLAIFTGLLVLFVLQLCCLTMAQYSLTLLLFVVGIFSFFVLISLLSRSKMAIALSVLFLLIIAVTAGVLLGPMLVSEGGVANNQDSVSTAEQAGLPTISIRVQSWMAAASIITESPEIISFQDRNHWLRRAIGYGPETLVAVIQTRFPDALKSRYTFDSTVIAQPENHYLFLGVTIGMLGLLAFLSILFLFFLLGFRLLMRNGDRESVTIISALIAAVAQYCVYILLNASVVTPELVFWVSLALMSAVARMHTVSTTAEPVLREPLPGENGFQSGSVSGGLRWVPASLAIAFFVGLSIHITVTPLVANMKVQKGLNSWSSDRTAALALIREATLLEPHQAYYLNFAGSIAFATARMENEPQRTAALLKTSEGYYSEAVQQEPQMAVWYYRLGDLDTYWAASCDKAKLADAISAYRKADLIFPGNAVILNKWATALMLNGDYTGSAAKLADSQRCDPSWVQTRYFEGLLQASKGNDEAAAGLFLSPVKNSYEGIRYFIDFCDSVSEYGKIALVKKALAEHVELTGGDWMPVAFLGIADVCAGDFAEAASAFRHSADLVPLREKGILAGAVQAMTMREAGFQESGRQIVDSLMRPAAKGN